MDDTPGMRAVARARRFGRIASDLRGAAICLEYTFGEGMRTNALEGLRLARVAAAQIEAECKSAGWLGESENDQPKP